MGAINLSYNSPFIDSSAQLNFDYLLGRKVFSELKHLHQLANRRTLLKSFLAIVTLVSSIALLILYPGSFFLGTGVGLIVLSLYAITYYWHQFKENTVLFRQAQAALNQR